MSAPPSGGAPTHLTRPTPSSAFFRFCSDE
jgi:hypothetical protein